jgi:hypothetical protein
MRISAATVSLLTLLGLWSRPATAADAGGAPCCDQQCDQQCDQCGRHVACLQKTCQVVCGVKKETKTCWCVECQEICPLMPGCHHHCDECPPLPRCGTPKCVKKLVKKEYQVEVPQYKCVVRNLCCECLEHESTDIPSTAPNPPMPPAPSSGQSLPPPPTAPARAPK